MLPGDSGVSSFWIKVFVMPRVYTQGYNNITPAGFFLNVELKDLAIIV